MPATLPSIDLPTTPVAAALFAAWSESLETHAHYLGRNKEAALESIRKTEALVGDALAALGRVRSLLEVQR